MWPPQRASGGSRSRRRPRHTDAHHSRASSPPTSSMLYRSLACFSYIVVSTEAVAPPTFPIDFYSGQQSALLINQGGYDVNGGSCCSQDAPQCKVQGVSMGQGARFASRPMTTRKPDAQSAPSDGGDAPHQHAAAARGCCCRRYCCCCSGAPASFSNACCGRAALCRTSRACFRASRLAPARHHESLAHRLGPGLDRHVGRAVQQADGADPRRREEFEPRVRPEGSNARAPARTHRVPSVRRLSLKRSGRAQRRACAAVRAQPCVPFVLVWGACCVRGLRLRDGVWWAWATSQVGVRRGMPCGRLLKRRRNRRPHQQVDWHAQGHGPGAGHSGRRAGRADKDV